MKWWHGKDLVLNKEVEKIYRTVVHSRPTGGSTVEPPTVPYSQVLRHTCQFGKIGAKGGFVAEPLVTAVSVRLLSVTQINIVDGTFRVQGQIDVRWYDPAMATYDFNTQVLPEESKTLIGKPIIRNAGKRMEVTGEETITVQPFPSDPKGLCRYVWTFKGLCTEVFQLEMVSTKKTALTRARARTRARAHRSCELMHAASSRQPPPRARARAFFSMHSSRLIVRT